MGAARDGSWFQPLIWIQYSNFARGLSFPIWVTETNVNATEINQVQLGGESSRHPYCGPDDAG